MTKRSHDKLFFRQVSFLQRLNLLPSCLAATAGVALAIPSPSSKTNEVLIPSRLREHFFATRQKME